nr:EAL domain-containing protein [Actinomycetota bacterium]
DGTLFFNELRIAPVREEDGRLVNFVGVQTDVTPRIRAEQALRKAEERYRTLVEKVSAIIYIQTPREGESAAYDTTYISPRVEEVLGYPPQSFTGDPGFWDRLIHPEDLGAVREEDERTDETGEPFSMEYRVIANDGRTVWIRDEATLVRDDGGEPLYWLGVQTDVTERRLREAMLRETEARYRSLVERVPAAIYRQEIEHNGAVSYISPQIEALTGYAPGEYADPTFWVRTMHPDDRARVLAEDERTDRTGEPFKVEFRKFARDGRLIWLRDEAVLVRDAAGEPLYWQGVVSDITERKNLEERLEHQAFHDPVTGLPNRRLFVDRLGQALQRTRRRKGRRVTVLFMDLDGFKNVNDSLGHEAGDLLLSVVAQRLRRCLRPEDALARFGGDEFVVLVEDVDDPAEAVRVAERITEELRRPFALEGRELYVSASVGISFGTARTKSPDDLLRDADTAMYRAKEAGSDYSLFDPAMHERAMGRLELENDLRRAIQEEEFIVHYQPIVRLDDRSVWGVEALVRWEHPERGLLNPDEFVPVAEESGLVVPMGTAVLEEACRRAKGWQEAYPKMPPLIVYVNLSARQLARPDLAEAVEGALRRTGFDGNCLGLDVTETVYVKALEGNTAALDRLRALGVRVSIDDFGTGYSSLSYLKRLPADALKIDKSFVRGLGEDVEDTTIVRMVVELAHTLGMEVIAEGVETEEQAALLAEMGCDKAQGYHFSRPLPPEDVPGFLGG